MSSRDARDWARRHPDYLGWVPTCPPCGNFIEDCACVCPFCGERNGCRCCIGLGIATGGD